MRLPYAHWHTLIPPSDPTSSFLPDPNACADMAMCFSYTIEHARDPVFVDQVGDPYAGVSMDWTGFSRFGLPALAGDGFEFEL
ncbi:fungal specific transcription factor domain protein, putative, partial [Rhizoctonia solani AG-3 Rhs1AP]